METAVHDLIHVQRLLREVPGDPVRFELSHESLADSVSEWIEEKELRIREIQEILDQEVSNAQKIKGFQFPLDKLRLIDGHREYLELGEDAINVVIKAFLKTGQLTEFWLNKLKESKGDDYYEVIFEQCLSDGKERLEILRFSNIIDIIEAALVKGVLLGSKYYINKGIKLIFEEKLTNVFTSIFLDINKVSSKRAEFIFKTFKGYAEKSQDSLTFLKTVINKRSIAEKLAKIVSKQSEHLTETTMKIILMDKSENVLAAIFRSLDEMDDTQAVLILKTCMMYGENHRNLFLGILEKQELNTLFLNRIIKSDMHHWPSVLRFLLEKSGSATLKMLQLRDEPKVVRIIFKFLRSNISSRLRRACIEFIENTNGPYALTELLKVLKNKSNRRNRVRTAILNALDKNIPTVINTHPEIVDMVIRSGIYFINDESVRLRSIISGCLPKIRPIVEAVVRNNDNSHKIRHFANLILKDYDNSQKCRQSDV